METLTGAPLKGSPTARPRQGQPVPCEVQRAPYSRLQVPLTIICESFEVLPPVQAS